MVRYDHLTNLLGPMETNMKDIGEVAKNMDLALSFVLRVMGGKK